MSSQKKTHRQRAGCSMAAGDWREGRVSCCLALCYLPCALYLIFARLIIVFSRPPKGHFSFFELQDDASSSPAWVA